MSGSTLPPDIREQIERQSARKQGHTGIGGAAHENQVSSQRRSAAVNPDAVAEDTERKATPAPDAEPELKTCPNTRCRKDLLDEWSFCAKCGTDLMRGGPAAALGIVWTEDDVSDYLFKGFVVRDLKILGKHKITIKSSQPQDMDEIDDYLMNGDWIKAKDGSQRNVSDLYLRQMNSLCIAASCISKFDGESIGATLAARVKYLRERGAALVDMFSGRVQLFNRALTEHLKKEDTFLGS